MFSIYVISRYTYMQTSSNYHVTVIYTYVPYIYNILISVVSRCQAAQATLMQY